MAFLLRMVLRVRLKAGVCAVGDKSGVAARQVTTLSCHGTNSFCP